MSENDVVETVEVEKAVIAAIKIVIRKKTLEAIFKELVSNTNFHAKVLAAWTGSEQILAELKAMTLSKYIDLAKAAMEEITAEDLASFQASRG